MNQKNLNSAISIRRLQDIWYIISLSILIEDSLQVFICLYIRVNYKLNYLELEWKKGKMIENFQQYEENDEDDENFRMFHSYWFKNLLILSFFVNCRSVSYWKEYSDIVKRVIHHINSFFSSWVKFWSRSWAWLRDFFPSLTRSYNVRRGTPNTMAAVWHVYSLFFTAVIASCSWASFWAAAWFLGRVIGDVRTFKELNFFFTSARSTVVRDRPGLSYGFFRYQ